MTIIYAFNVHNKGVVIKVDSNIDYNAKNIILDGKPYSFNVVYDSNNCITIPLKNIDAKTLINKQIRFVS